MMANGLASVTLNQLMVKIDPPPKVEPDWFKKWADCVEEKTPGVIIQIIGVAGGARIPKGMSITAPSTTSIWTKLLPSWKWLPRWTRPMYAGVWIGRIGGVWVLIDGAIDWGAIIGCLIRSQTGPLFTWPEPSSAPKRDPNWRCFVAGTLVHTLNGMKPIETIRVSDTVLSWNHLTGDFEYRHVRQIFEASVMETIELGGETWHLNCSPQHRFLMSDGKWKKAGDIGPGELIMTSKKSLVSVSHVKQITGDGAIRVYNFTVDGTHNYCVTEMGLIAHNFK
jgi:hypothetical protein